MDVVLLFGFLALLAFLIESSVEHFIAVPYKTIREEGAKGTWWLRYVALVAALGFAFAMRLGLFGLLTKLSPDLFGGWLETVPAWFDFVITALLISRGAQYVSDFGSRLKITPAQGKSLNVNEVPLKFIQELLVKMTSASSTQTSKSNKEE